MRLFLNELETYKLDRFDELVAEDEFKSRENTRLAINNQHLYVLAAGCHKHPSYRAHRRPTVGCAQCESLFFSATYLRDNGFKALNARKPGKKAKVV